MHTITRRTLLTAALTKSLFPNDDT
ncbi:MAG: hypothetical protein JWP63_6305, partial [Candidatus Solibacter sp.]|nr:hypothetical protein [Candidatus Solibacter sp.]